MGEVISQLHSLCPRCDQDTWHTPVVKTRRGWTHRTCAEGDE